ncbi:MAG: hypothetical protein DHS20C17_24450 [Cyclobacteriaceae bacterium]|nr:MAG: hypothetical protein DHS20C17_24450 [Cyclobacteriaceae bacterium]
MVYLYATLVLQNIKSMKKLKSTLLCLLGVALSLVTNASNHSEPNKPKPPPDDEIEFLIDCDNAVAQIDLSVNNVRARLLTGGDLWWNGESGQYIVPNVPPGEPAVSAISAAAVWMGGFDPAGNLKLAAQTYGRAGGNFDYWPGPLTPFPDPDDENVIPAGITDKETCKNWDKFFVVNGSDVELHIKQYEAAKRAGLPYDVSTIPPAIRGWPARGNRFFHQIHFFDLPNNSQGLASFWDRDGNGLYEPDEGDFPVFSLRGCRGKPQYPDQIIFWIYNDAGNIHAESGGDPIQMEVQAEAFAYATDDEINDMTFYRYKLINRAVESIDSTFFAWWVDPGLGCGEDDYIGCDVSRSLAYVYNEDVIDGHPAGSCDCPNGAATYCEEIPLLGYDIFRGPLDEYGSEIGMTSFTYYVAGGGIDTPPGITGPSTAQEYYNYMSGTWRDGTPFTRGGDGYEDGTAQVQYVFADPPNAPAPAWSMCSAGLGSGDRYTIQSSGPFRLDPGAVNELIVGVMWVPDQEYPCPSIRRLQHADDVAQDFFDKCFIHPPPGPDAPDVDWVELDQEVIAVFTNDTIFSNNAFEDYREFGLFTPPGVQDSLFEFEGYKLFQLKEPITYNIELDDPDKARLVYQADKKNGIGSIFNWQLVDNPTGERYFEPVLQVEGADEGIRHTFRITEDQFAEGDRRLVNHKKYYFVAVAYAHNEYLPFDPEEFLGQKEPYQQGIRNIGDGQNRYYTVIPRPIVDRKLNANFGDGAIITRIDGIGAGGIFLDMSAETREVIEKDIRNNTNDFDGQITYRPGRGPIEIQVFNPLEVKDGEFELTLIDEDMSNDQLDNTVRWQLTSLNDPTAPVIFSERTIDQLNEQIIKEFGFTLTVTQSKEFGELGQEANGVIAPGFELEYTAGEAAVPWLTGIPDGTIPGIGNFLDQAIFNYVANGSGELDELLDQDQALSQIGAGYFVPYMMANWRTDPTNDIPYITPAWSSVSGSNIVRNQLDLADVNNVDIVFTKDKSLWTRSTVIETANRYYYGDGGQSGAGLPGGQPAEGGTDYRFSFDLRSAPSVSKYDTDGDRLPDKDDTGTSGLGWFPGYALDVETGQRLYVFFGENSVYDCAYLEGLGLSGACDLFNDGIGTGGDMMFNPSDQLLLSGAGFANVLNYNLGGQHFVYVTKLPYEEGLELFEERLAPGASSLTKVRAIREITWAGTLMLESGTSMSAYGAGEEGLIPDDLVVKLRGDNPYQVKVGTGDFNGYPTYRFKLEGLQAEELTPEGIETALDLIKVVPNPYYAFSEYENDQFSTTVKITNLPAQCVVTIFSLDGKFIRKFNRNESGTKPRGHNRALTQTQISPDLEWDLKNAAGSPIASGVYLIHVYAPDFGERTLKWFGINRLVNPSGL